MATELNGKLDGQLEVLLHSGHVVDTVPFPVVVRAVAGQLELVVNVLRDLGRVRHVMSPLNSVSAWLPLEALEGLLLSPAVEGIELAQPVEMAVEQ